MEKKSFSAKDDYDDWNEKGNPIIYEHESSDQSHALEQFQTEPENQLFPWQEK